MNVLSGLWGPNPRPREETNSVLCLQLSAGKTGHCDHNPMLQKAAPAGATLRQQIHFGDLIQRDLPVTFNQ